MKSKGRIHSRGEYIINDNVERYGIAMKEYAQEWIAEIEQMFMETFPKAEGMLQTIVVEFVSARNWNRRREKVAQLCGEEKSKQQQIKNNLDCKDDAPIYGEFIFGEKGQAILLRTEVLNRKELFAEVLFHELAHGYCYWLEKQDKDFPVECQLGRCENEETQLGYYIWKEFIAQTISLKICKERKIKVGKYTDGDLKAYLTWMIKGPFTESDMGMFCAEFFSNGGNDKRLREMVENQDELIADDVRQIYHLLTQKLKERDCEEVHEDFLIGLGECVKRFRLDKLIQRLFNGQKNLQRVS